MSKKKIIAVVSVILVVVIAFIGILYYGIQKMDNKGKTEKVKIVATLFPQYDFAKQIAKDKADITLLLPPGTESHSFEPTPADITTINDADLFIYTGKYMETWVEPITDSISKKVNVLDVSKNIELAKEEDEDADEEYNPHIWTDPKNAIQMCNNILDSLCQVDPANSDYYKENADKYIDNLNSLDNDFREMINSSKRHKIISGSRFPFYYFANEYGLTYDAAFDSCDESAEPSAKKVADLIDEIKKDNIPVVYYEELTDPKVARTISNETNTEMLLLHSAHNVSKEDFDKGITYLDIMRQNLVNLKKGLN